MKESTLDNEIKQTEEKLKELYKKRADELCPFKVGDVIKGKLRIAKLIEIKPGESRYDPYKMIGTWQLKSGEFSSTLHELWGYEWDNAVKV